MRAASLDAVARALESRPAEVVVVAPTASAGEWPADATWDFAGFGVARAPSDPRPVLPWSLGIGAWLLLCKGEDGDTCLTKPQLKSVETFYGGLKNSKGELIFSGQALGNPLPALRSNPTVNVSDSVRI